MRLVARWDRGAYLLAGSTWIALNTDPAEGAMRLGDDSHIAFSVEFDELGPLSQRIVAAGPTIWRRSTNDHSFYFTDPDGHKLELHGSDLDQRLAEYSVSPPEGFVRFDATSEDTKSE
jgi:catechol 2,3-dioxygenase-like lactoylglutathione lyase family enzyme